MLKVKEAEFIRKMDRMGMSGARIARLVGVSRATVRRYIDMEVFPPPPRHVERKSMLDPFRDLIAGWVTEDLALPRPRRRSATRIWQTLRDEHGFHGSYRIVARYIQQVVREATAPTE